MNFNVRFYLAATFLTGLAGLTYQVVWQRYMTILIGAEAKSSTIIVSVFLLGLAIGYYFWGRVAQKIIKRSQLLKIYGYIELTIGAYGILFPSFFSYMREWSYSLAPGLASDLLIGHLFMILPTFCMGATIPLLTSSLPKSLNEINRLHAKVYGINTLGAFVGALLSAFWLIPNLGLPITSMLMGVMNVLIAILFIGNRLEGKVHKSNEKIQVEHCFPVWSLYFLVLISGILTMSSEILWVRLWSLTIGASTIVFPMVIALFVLGIGYGALNIKKISADELIKEMGRALVFFIISFIVVPYLPNWMAYIRTSLTSIERNYYIFYSVSFLSLAFVLLPFVIPLGRIIPLSYGLLKKDENDFGFKCGLLYFFNTIGTFIGPIVFGYLLLEYFNIDKIYKFLIISFSMSYVLFLFYNNISQKKYKILNWQLIVRNVFVLMALMILNITPLSQWNRRFHVAGSFRIVNNSKLPIKNLLDIPPMNQLGFNTRFLKDGVNTTVSVLETGVGKKNISNSIMVNAKSDSNTIIDYETTALVSFIPYLLLNKKKSIQSIVVGLGTGVTSGVLALAPDVENIDVVEISPTVVKALTYFDGDNFGRRDTKKISFHTMDAFKYFHHRRQKADIIISEPTNPWVSGVENLFTSDFYKLVRNSLSDKGLFSQWFHTYSMSEESMASIFKNMFDVFSYVELFVVNKSDILLVASNQHFMDGAPYAKKRFQNSAFSKLEGNLKMPNVESLYLLHHYNSQELRHIAMSYNYKVHTLENPSLAMRSLKSFFLKEEVHINKLLDPYIARHIPELNKLKRSKIEKVMTYFSKNPKYCSVENHYIYSNIFCKRYSFYGEIKKNLELKDDKNKANLEKKLLAYSVFRKKKLIDSNIGFLEKAAKNSAANSKNNIHNLQLLFKEFLKEGDWSRADEQLTVLDETGQLDKMVTKGLRTMMIETQKQALSVQRWLENQKI